MSDGNIYELNPLSFSQRMKEVDDIQNFIKECYDGENSASFVKLHEEYKTLYQQETGNQPSKPTTTLEGLMFIFWVEFLIDSTSLEGITISRLYQPSRNFENEILIHVLFNKFQLSILHKMFEEIVIKDVKQINNIK